VFGLSDLFDRKGLFKGYPVERRDVIRRYVRDKGLEWVIGALVDGSIGYHSYLSAKRLIDRVVANKFALCERTSAIFNGDASKEILWDIRLFEDLEKRNPDKVKRILELVKRMKSLNMIQSWTLSMAYPTLNI